MRYVFVAHCHVAHVHRPYSREDNGIDDSFELYPRETYTLGDLMTMVAAQMKAKHGRKFVPYCIYCYSDSGVRCPAQGSIKFATVREFGEYLQHLKPNDEKCHVHVDLRRS